MLNSISLNFGNNLVSHSQQKGSNINYIVHQNPDNSWYIEKQELVNGKWETKYIKQNADESEIPQSAYGNGAKKKKSRGAF